MHTRRPVVASAILLATAASVWTLVEAENVFETESGGFRLAWSLEGGSVRATMCANATGFVGIGFGSGMANTDMIIGWVYENGTAFVGDFWSSGHKKPQLDTALGGTDDVKLLGGSAGGGRLCVEFARALETGDRFDAVLSGSAAETELVYAWADGEPGLRFHGDNHNAVRIDMARADGVPQTQFGQEESGVAARAFFAAHNVGTLSTLQLYAPGRAGMYPFPYASVADYADEAPSTGLPLLLLSTLERNIVNAERVSNCSLAVHTPQSNDTDPMAATRMTLLGTLAKVPDAEYDKARDTYLQAHPMARMWVNFSDFSIYRMQVQDVYWVGGFGDSHYIGWLGADAYLAAGQA